MNYRKNTVNIICLLMITLIPSSIIGQNSKNSHLFRYYAPHANSVSVVGNFNNWDPGKNSMEKNNSGYWLANVLLENGIHQYGFIVDDVFRKDPKNNDIWNIKRDNDRKWVSMFFIPESDQIHFPKKLKEDLKNIKFKLFNAPVFHYEFPNKDKEIYWVPRIYVELNVQVDFNNILFEVTIYDSENKPIAVRSRIARSKKGFYDTWFRFEKELNNPDYVIFKLKTERKEYQVKKDIKSFCFSGRVTDFEGYPVEGAHLMIGSGCVYTYCDSQGYFKINLPSDIYRRNCAIDNQYGISHFENYFIDLVLNTDKYIDFKIGELEVYQLNVAPISETQIIQGQFTVWSISSIRENDGYPQLTPDEVNIFLNGKKAELKILSKIKRLADDRQAELEGWYFEALVPKNLKRLDRNDLVVFVEHKAKDEKGKVMIEKGQAQYLNLIWP